MMRTSPKKINQHENYQQQIRLLSRQEKAKVKYQKSKVPVQGAHQRSPRLDRRKHSIKAYHFANAIYQGQMRAFHRTGRGLLLHDNGMTGIIRSGSNRLKDHNIFLGQNIIISVVYKQHEIEFVYKNDQKILVLTMQRNNNTFKTKSPGFLIQLDQHMVYKLKFKSNKLVQKVALNLQDTDQIIEKSNFEKLMGQIHINALKFNFYDSQSPQINVILKNDSQLQIGFVQTSHYQYSTTYQIPYFPQQSQNHELHGLGFVVQKRDFDSNKQFNYSFKILSRGFYSHGRLQYFGQIYYENGNHYFGRIREQKMHGNGILVYQKERRFVYGQFFEGRPVKLDENIAFRLDTQQGRNIYMNLRKKLHGQDPQVWINNQVHDQPSGQYFLRQLQECMSFRYEDEQINNIRKKQEQLYLSRKVQDFKQQSNSLYKKSLTGRLTNALYNRNNYLTSQYLLDKSRSEEQTIRKQLQIQGIRRSRSKAKQLEREAQRHQTLRSTKRDRELNETPIHKIHKFQLNRSELNNPQINQSIINNFTFSGEKKIPETQKINTSSSKKQSSSIINEVNPRISQKSNSRINIDQNFQNYQFLQPYKKNSLEDQFSINVHSPIGRNSKQRSLSKSVSKSSLRSQSGSRSISRSQQGSMSKISYKKPQEKVSVNPSRKLTQKTSIIQKLYTQTNLRAQKLEKQYEILQKKNKSPYKNLTTKQKYINENISSPSPRRLQVNRFSPSKTNQPYRHPDLTNQIFENFAKQGQEIKCLVAANEALRLANSNKVKQQKFLQYDHFTHKKRFDYTSDSYDNVRDKKYQVYDHRYQRTPEKNQQYNYNNITDSQRTVRKEKVDSVVNRLYPHQNQTQLASREFQPGKIFDSSYDQSRPLNKIGRTRQDDRTINFEEPVYKYSTALKSSILKNNVFVKS